VSKNITSYNTVSKNTTNFSISNKNTTTYSDVIKNKTSFNNLSKNSTNYISNDASSLAITLDDTAYTLDSVLVYLHGYLTAVPNQLNTKHVTSYKEI